MTNFYKEKLHLLEEKNYYKILDLDEDCDLETLSKQYKVLAKKFHPDANHALSHSEKKELTSLFQIITLAFNTIKDPEERKKHDHQLGIEKYKKQKQEEVKVTSEKPINPKNTGIGFSFSQVKHVDIEQIKKEKEEKEKQALLVRFQQAKKHIDEKNYDDAVAILRDLTEKKPMEAQYHSYLGLAMQNKGWNGYAQAEFKVALHYNPNDEIALKYHENKFEPPKIITKTNGKEDDASGFMSRVKSLFGRG